MRKKLAIGALAMTLAGCSTDGLFVGTYTRVGIDASKDGAGAGIGVKNIAVAVAPTKENGDAYNILGKTDIDLAFTDFALFEIVATGEAAECASGKSTVVELTKAVKGTTETADAAAVEAATPFADKTPGVAALIAAVKDKTEKTAKTEKKKQPNPLIFVAGTSWSLLDVSLGEATGPSISFGYRRTVGIRMPIKNEVVGSSYASVSINTMKTKHSNDAEPSQIKGGTRSVYVFATGTASINMAQKYAGNIAQGMKGCDDA